MTGAMRRATTITVALATVVTATGLTTMLDPDLLSGPAAMRGSALGTALAMLATVVPLLLASVVGTARGSGVAQLTWLGALGLATYNALVFLFATPFNRLFLLYVAWLGLAVWSTGTLLAAIDLPALGLRFGASAPRRAVAAYIWVAVGLNATAWLSRIGPAVASGDPADLLRGTGVSTNVVYVQDLALWLPLMAVVAAWLWRGRPAGLVLGAAGLVMWCLESVGIAVDQAYGAAFDASSPVVSAAFTPLFAALAVVGLVPILLLLKGFDEEGLTQKALRLAPPGDRRSASARALAVTALTVSAAAVYGGLTLARGGWDMPSTWLAGTPFTSWTMPGVALLVGVGVPQLVTAGAVALGWSFARLVALACAGLLVAWIALQLLVLQRTFFLQAVIAGVGLVELWLVRRWGRGGHGPDGDGEDRDLRPETPRTTAVTVRT